MNWDNTKCIVLCAGKGSRLLPLSVEKPKVMVKIKDKPILGYVIDYWKKYTSNFIFIVSYKKEEIIEFVEQLSIKAEFVEQKEPRGIANAVSYAEDKVPDRFIVVLGDCICQGDFSYPKNMEQGVGVWEATSVEDIKQSYSVKIKNSFIYEVEEKPKKIINNLCGMGFYFFNQKVFQYISLTKLSRLRNEIEITDVIQNMINAGEKIAPVFFHGDYLNITYYNDLQRAEKIIAKV
jgi:bifunctional UDP-N-acetylglucosamine pyrophosphorylase/glucosamine-1-phosphate N-acetyltransferase